MARTGIDQIAVLTDTTCGNPRADEAVKWGLVQDSLKSISHRGQTLVSAWGPKVDGNVRPILGGSVKTRTRGEGNANKDLFFPAGTHTHEIVFEQPSFITSGAVSVVDRFVLNTKFVLCNKFVASGTFTATSDTFKYFSYGRVKITLSNSGGTQVLLDHTSAEYLALIAGSGITTTTGISSGGFQEVELSIEGSLGNTLIPPTGSSFDSKLIFEVSGYFEDDGDPTFDGLLSGLSDGMPALVPFASAPPYLGIAGATFRIFNPAA